MTTTDPRPTSDDAPIEVSGLVKDFGDFRAVDDFALTVRRGTVHGFLGPNGAGKSTVIRVLLGLLRADAGVVTVLGSDPARSAPDINARVSYVPGDVALWPNLTGRQALDVLAELRGAALRRRGRTGDDDPVDRELESELIERLALDPDKKIRSYSKGNRQKVMLVAAFSARTELLLLDEPTSGLDPLMEQHFRAMVGDAARRGRTVLLSSHLLSEVEKVCEEVTIIRDGALVETGSLNRMRHLAASRVTARDPDVDRNVPRDDVPAVLADLVEQGATDITCTPASLEDLFLRHYEVDAR